MPTAFKNKHGRTRYKFSLEEIRAADEAMEGFCINCGESRDCCEPDARDYPCDNCGENKVYGAQELALMGYVV